MVRICRFQQSIHGSAGTTSLIPKPSSSLHRTHTHTAHPLIERIETSTACSSSPGSYKWSSRLPAPGYSATYDGRTGTFCAAKDARNSIGLPRLLGSYRHAIVRSYANTATCAFAAPHLPHHMAGCLKSGHFIASRSHSSLTHTLLLSCLTAICTELLIMRFNLRIRIAREQRRFHALPVRNAHFSMHPQHQSRLLALPAEIRLQIYELVLQLSSATLELASLPRRLQVHLSILQTCRRILFEAEDVFYSINHFKYTAQMTRRSLASFLTTIGPTRRNAIAAMTICTSSGSDAFEALEQLHLVPNITSCTIERGVSIRYLNVSGWSVLAKQMTVELAKLESLRDFRVLTPEANELTAEEEKRCARLREIDTMLEESCGTFYVGDGSVSESA